MAPTVAVIVPTVNAGPRWRQWLDSFRTQTQPCQRRIVIDSSSDDATAALARDAGFEVTVIPRAEFDHGGTRQLGVELARDAEIVVFLSQDAVLTRPDSIERLVACFENSKAGAAFGRQMPYPDAGPIERHARAFNYPAKSRLKRLSDAPALGFRTIFMSNAFSAYRHSVLDHVGGFKTRLISMEDEYLAARIVQAGYAIAYCAEAQVMHSHQYTMRQEFSRYFDFGVFHAREPWIREAFGQAEGEGIRFVRSQLGFLMREAPWLIPAAMLRMAAKLAGFRCGALESRLPLALKRRLGMNRRFWMTPEAHQ